MYTVEMENKLALLILLLAALLGSSSGLLCYKSSLMNRLDVTRQVDTEECDDDEVSCEGIAYSVGSMWYMKYGCSKEDKDECSVEKRGQNDHFTCYCKTDYCNGAGKTETTMGFAAAAAVVTAALSRIIVQ